MSTSVTARVDHENNAEEFWGEFRDRVDSLVGNSELACNCRRILTCGEVELTDAKAISEFDGFVHSIPGFSAGPNHATQAIVFQVN